ncbi:adenylate kinase [uncultured Jatrophihabitans sp.]|uniref:adenylate kinase n=1 Tax=uncultured Jatrophihabitans sp. TaxID=1610747 RepID=UPI0035CC3095
MRLVLVGPPGAGKGTQAEFIADRFGIPKISTGDIFRSNVSGGTELGKQAKEYMDAGDLVPDEVTNAMVRDRLAEPDAVSGFLLDGFPRNVSQADELNGMLASLDVALSVVLDLDVDHEEVVNRLAGRRTCKKCGHVVHVEPDAVEGGACPKCGGELYRRDDDAPDTVRHRLEVYDKQTAPLIGFYRDAGLLVAIDAFGTVEDVTERAISVLAQYAES